jgi:hypothetical protein
MAKNPEMLIIIKIFKISISNIIISAVWWW